MNHYTDFIESPRMQPWVAQCKMKTFWDWLDLHGCYSYPASVNTQNKSNIKTQSILEIRLKSVVVVSKSHPQHILRVLTGHASSFSLNFWHAKLPLRNYSTILFVAFLIYIYIYYQLPFYISMWQLPQWTLKLSTQIRQPYSSILGNNSPCKLLI